jgi:hypothetical protein
MNAAILSLKEVKFWSLLRERRDYSRVSVQPCICALADQRLGHPSLTCGNVGDSPQHPCETRQAPPSGALLYVAVAPSGLRLGRGTQCIDAARHRPIGQSSCAYASPIIVIMTAKTSGILFLILRYGFMS